MKFEELYNNVNLSPDQIITINEFILSNFNKLSVRSQNAILNQLNNNLKLISFENLWIQLKITFKSQSKPKYDFGFNFLITFNNFPLPQPKSNHLDLIIGSTHSSIFSRFWFWMLIKSFQLSDFTKDDFW